MSAYSEADKVFFENIGFYLWTMRNSPDQLDSLPERLTAWDAARSGAIKSPIEMRLYAFFCATPEIHFVSAGQDRPSQRVYCDPQASIGPYRADFLFTVKFSEEKFIKIVVECDGHDFHEKTKEQAAHDKARDRYMTTSGISVLRYTGSEIFRNPAAVAIEVLQYIQDLVEGKVSG